MASDGRPGANESDGAWARFQIGNNWGTPGVFGKECANDWKDRRWESLFVKSDKEGMVCLVQGTVDRSGSTGDTHPPGSLYEYQKKGDAGEGVRMSVKTKGLERRERGGSFELDLITLVSLACVSL